MHKLNLLFGIIVVTVQVRALQAHVILLDVLLCKFEIHSASDDGPFRFFRASWLLFVNYIHSIDRIAVVAISITFVLLVLLKGLLVNSSTVLHIATFRPHGIIRFIHSRLFEK